MGLDYFAYRLKTGDGVSLAYVSDEDCNIESFDYIFRDSKIWVNVSGLKDLDGIKYKFKIEILPEDFSALEKLVKHLIDKKAGIPTEKAKIYHPED